MTGSGTVLATIAVGKAHDAAGNPNAASTSTDNSVTYDATSPTVKRFHPRPRLYKGIHVCDQRPNSLQHNKIRQSHAGREDTAIPRRSRAYTRAYIKESMSGREDHAGPDPQSESRILLLLESPASFYN